MTADLLLSPLRRFVATSRSCSLRLDQMQSQMAASFELRSEPSVNSGSGWSLQRIDEVAVSVAGGAAFGVLQPVYTRARIKKKYFMAWLPRAEALAGLHFGESV